MSARLPRPTRHGVTALVAGALTALALPPWGFWPLAIVGIALFETTLHAARTGRQRLVRGWLFGLGWLAPGMVWMWFLTVPGYLVATLLFALLHGVAAWAAPTGSWRVLGRPAAHTLVEALRFCFPFGGVPLASLAIGQAGGPFLDVARIGGAVLLTWFTFQLGFALAGPSPVVPALARQRGVTARGEWHGVIMFVLAVGTWLLAPAADGTHATGRTIRVAAVQGGGPQGTHAIHSDPRVVFERHLEASHAIEAGSVDMVLWPENVIDVVSFADSQELAEVSAEAARIGAPFVIGITEDTADPNRFVNSQVVVTPDGEVVSRYDKVRRVPFGEYMPMRGLLHALGAPTDMVPHDAVAGTGPAYLELPDGTRMAVAISWEIFFGGRVNDGMQHGAQFVINPTNGSSYTWTVLQTQQVASSRLRAVEQGRWVVQAAPTGFSTFVSPDGTVHQRTSVSEREVITREFELREGRTWYSHLGNIPWVILMVLLFAGSWVVPGRAWWRGRAERAAAAIATPATDGD